jgi:hypothetical protein
LLAHSPSCWTPRYKTSACWCRATPDCRTPYRIAERPLVADRGRYRLSLTALSGIIAGF